MDVEEVVHPLLAPVQDPILKCCTLISLALVKLIIYSQGRSIPKAIKKIILGVLFPMDTSQNVRIFFVCLSSKICVFLCFCR